MVTGSSAVVAVLSPEASVLVWGLVLLVLMLGVAAAFVVIRKRAVEAELRREEQAAAGGFTIERLEELHRGGQLSDEEFHRLRRQVLRLSAGQQAGRGSSSPPSDDDGNAISTHPGH